MYKIQNSDCPRSAETIGQIFFKKFPKNLLRGSREKALSDLLTIRLKVCLRKERENHWYRLNKIIQKSVDGSLDKLSPKKEESSLFFFFLNLVNERSVWLV
jgi:hypothetical protein